MPEGTFTWEFDAATGVYKNHDISGKLLKVAARQWKFVPFTKKETSFGKGKGESLTLVYYRPLKDPSSAQLEESTRVPIDQLAMGRTNITIKEWGRGVEYTSLARDLGKFNPKEGAQEALKDQMGQAMDVAAASEFVGPDAKIAFVPTTLTGGVWDNDGVPSTVAQVNMTKNHVAIVRDYMIKDLHVPFYEGEHYIGAFSTKALRGLRDDRVIEAWNMYLRKGDHIYRGEIGQVESVRLVEITNEAALSNSVGNGSVLGEGVVFGRDAVARIEVEFPHLRAQPNYVSDFGRRHAVAWYGTVAFGVKFPVNTDRLARIVRITSQ